MKRDVLTVTYFLDPKHKRHVEIPLARVGALLVALATLTVLSVVGVWHAITEPRPTFVYVPHARYAPPAARSAPSASSTAAAATVPTSGAATRPTAHRPLGAPASPASAEPAIKSAKAEPAVRFDPATVEPFRLTDSTAPWTTWIPAPKPARIRLEGLRFERHDHALLVHFAVINISGDGSEAAGTITGSAEFAADDAEPVRVHGSDRLSFRAKRSTKKRLRFLYPDASGEFRNVAVTITDADGYQPLVVQTSVR